jgi:hypothetical protein|tara:strand:+ start:232 stop:948 length:717 start_codon:yes stop_codon:yes gene_type:complete
MIKFNEKYHSYTNSYTGEKYVSATTLIHKFTKPFDTEKHSKRVAEREGTTPEEIKDLWKEENKKACDYGNYVHQVMEDWLNDKAIDFEDEEKYVKPFLEIVDETFDKSTITPEKRLWNHEHKVAGTTDVFQDNKRFFNLYDFKTNKRFNFNNTFSDYMLGDFSHLSNCQYNIYSLQLSMYAYMEQCLSGKHVGELGLFYYDRNTSLWKYYPVSYMKKEIELMFGLLKSGNLPVNKENE